MSADRSRLGLTFGIAAESYERYRLGYPTEVADTVLAYAGRPVRSALEVGAGTGKATRLFAGLGIRVTAVEPDPAMAELLRAATRALPVEPVVSTFEDVVADRGFDLLYSAAALHWTDPETRWTRALSLLAPQGTMALFGCPGDLSDPALAGAVARIEREFLREGADRSGAPWSVEDVRRVYGFIDVTERVIARSTRLAADDYVGRLTTVSAYLVLDAATRDAALRAVRAALPDQVVTDSSVTLLLARRG